jgi:hypothetical protein
MRQLRLLLIAAFAILAFGAVASAVANAEEDKGSPSLLAENVNTLAGHFNWGVSELSALGLPDILQGLTGEGKLKECKELEGSKTDTTLCLATLDFFSVKVKGTTTACRSETEAKVKDPAETVLVLADVHIASELSQGGVLEPLVIFKVRGEENESPAIISCGLVKIFVLGAIGCLLLPGLEQVAANVEGWSILCKTDLTKGTEGEPNGDQLTGECKQLCESLTSDPFMAGLTKAGGEMAAFLVHATGSFNQTAIVDD